MSETLVRVSGLSKKYSRNQVKVRRMVRNHVLRTILGLSSSKGWQNDDVDTFCALNDVSFEVKRGEVFGFIGHNGAGKTTLLNILAGHFLPDDGEVSMSGRVVSLINLAQGMNGNLTGRENIYTKAALNGLSHKQASERERQIIDFAELHHCIDRPYKTYSSGMKMRLAFAINVHSDADIVLVDEVLSVGDMAFRNKCYEHFQKLKDDVAIILVSHSMTDIARFCDVAVLMELGHFRLMDEPTRVIEQYQDMVSKSEVSSANVPGAGYSGTHIEADTNRFRLHKLTVNDVDMAAGIQLRHGQRMVCEFCFDVRNVLQDLNLSLVFYRDGEQVFNLETMADGVDIVSAEIDDGWRRVHLTCDIDHLPLVEGSFSPVFLVHDGPKYLVRQPVATMRVVKDKPYRFGVVSVEKKWLTENIEQGDG